MAHEENRIILIYSKLKENNESFSFAGWLSEDGGRLYNKRNYGLVKTVNFEDVELVNDNFNWFSLYQLKEFIHSDAIVNPHLMRLMFL